MNTGMLMKQLTAAGLVGAMTSLIPAASQAAPTSKTIRVLSVSGVDASAPDAAVWKKAPMTQVALQPAFAGHPSIVGTPAATQISAQAVRSGNQLFVRLAWSDATVNNEINDTGQFLDGAAVQFPINGKAATTPFMGDPNNAVNIWHWRADGLTENMIAKGYGTSMSVPLEALHSASMRSDGSWAIVLARPLKVKADQGASLSNRKSMPIAFAAWDGASQERDGLKAVTLEWWQLKF